MMNESAKQIVGARLSEYYENYEELDFLGKGSYGRVIKVRQKSTGAVYAAKKIEVQGMSESELGKTREQIEIHKKLNHINIIKMYAYFIGETSIILLTEFCQYGDLAYYIDKRRREFEKGGPRFEEQFIMNLFLQMLFGLNYLHTNKVVHRDIKPSNIFIDSEGRIKLADFGIAQMMDRTGSLIKSGPQLNGTPLYLSPQVCKNSPLTEKSDIWALGCVVYEMCDLCPVFQAGNILALATMITEKGVPDIDQQFSANLNALIHWMLQKKCELRPKVSEILQLTFVREYASKFMSIQLPRKCSSPKKRLQKVSEYPIIQHQSDLMEIGCELANSKMHKYHQNKQKCERQLGPNNYRQLHENISILHKQMSIMMNKEEGEIKELLFKEYGHLAETAHMMYQIVDLQWELSRPSR